MWLLLPPTERRRGAGGFAEDVVAVGVGAGTELEFAWVIRVGSNGEGGGVKGGKGDGSVPYQDTNKTGPTTTVVIS